MPEFQYPEGFEWHKANAQSLFYMGAPAEMVAAGYVLGTYGAKGLWPSKMIVEVLGADQPVIITVSEEGAMPGLSTTKEGSLE